MPIRPEDIDPTKLPVAFRGYDRGPTDDLLKRVAWDYRQALRIEETWTQERERLRAQIAELEERVETQQAEFAQALAQRLTARDTTSERTAQLEAEVRRLERLVHHHESRQEIAEGLLQTAKRMAHELRESAREDAEATLKAAHRRAAEIEREAHVDARHANAEIGRLQQLESDLRDRLRETLQAVIGENGHKPGQASEPRPEPESSVDPS
ncbi:MAG TPA: DivIVA domain-containing protein [Gaiellaceae bacterium]|nr:DivIVA domain-containing protein [Gaiellaceae bacterium]